MHGAHDYLVGLTQLHELGGVDEQRAVWRQSMATLATMAAGRQPTPLEGLHPEAVLASVRVALDKGFVDDLGWLSKALAAAALFELAAALPTGKEKRELGRRVLSALHDPDAATFITLATSLALASPKALSGAQMRARLALSLRLPIGAGAGADALALALISRPELEREWLVASSTGSLPARRQAARLLERAAREAAQRAVAGDDSGLRIFDRPSVKVAWDRLMADRESLVWRHVATARGLLAGVAPMRAAEIDRELSARGNAIHWRRAATSLAATVAHDPIRALARCRAVISSDLRKRDAGISAAMIFGLVRAGEEEPEAAEELLRDLMVASEVDALEALVELRAEHVGSPFGERAVALALERLRKTPRPSDDGLAALLEALANDLRPKTHEQPHTLPSKIAVALMAFAEGKTLSDSTAAALEVARSTITSLEKMGDQRSEERRRAFWALRELDMGLLETSALGDLVALAKLESNAIQTLTDVMARLTSWILEREITPLSAGDLSHITMRMRRLRTLLHLLDSDGAADDAVAAVSRPRRLAAFRVLLSRVQADAPSPLRRTLCSALARACDALVREDACELSDLLVAVSSHVRAGDDLRIVSEASMTMEVKEIFRALGDLVRALPVGSERTSDDRSAFEALRALADALPPGASARVEGLRRAFLGIARPLEAIVEARSLAEIKPSEGPSAVERLEESVRYCAQIVAGVRRRLGLPGPAQPSAASALRELDATLDRSIREVGEDVIGGVRAVIGAVRADLPEVIGELVGRGLGRLVTMPAEAPLEAISGTSSTTLLAADRRLRLPPWLPPSRMLGGFFVVRPIGSGAAASVFVAKRAEERHDEAAESFALKVPAYNGQAALTLSEEEFLQLFREEAGALLTLPQHQNLSGFVTFDLGTRPKPILVMELVLGPTLERIVDKKELSVSLALSILDGVAGGLQAMHAVGVGHLDVKPSNIILRVPKFSMSSRLLSIDESSSVPILVDFGLAGRKVRPGCASPYYGAPEVWDAQGAGKDADPRATDVYAFSCLAYELLTGRTLFSADTLPALVATHLTHDGGPPALASLRKDPMFSPVADILTAGLLQDPSRRPCITDMRAALASVSQDLLDLPWPVEVAA